jgi:histidinol dehydrogenase
MEVIRYPEKKDYGKILARPSLDLKSLEATVTNILEDVKENGDAAVGKYSLMFDKVLLRDFAVPPEEIGEAAHQLDEKLKQAIRQAMQHIRTFHQKQVQPPELVETSPGIECWRKNVAIEKVGLYIPGGTAPLFSTLLMLAVPAVIAGCGEIILCSPPDIYGKLHPAILYAAQLNGITKIFRIGGVQAIAALAYGTQQIPRVYKIFGPGNQYVMCAKQMVQRDDIAIDLPAGPSELAIFADQTANPVFVAADLLSQAEHGTDSQVLLVSDAQPIIEAVLDELAKQENSLPRKQIVKKALLNSKVILVGNAEEAMELINAYAPEHLILACENADRIAERVINAGSVFLGHFSAESAGDYASGTNHTLPTNGNARCYSGVSVDSFVKKITFQRISRSGLSLIGETVEQMARAEGLEAHAQAISVRLGDR